MIAAVYTETGTKHDKNQDSFYISYDNEKGLFVVADGMGGHAAGDIASKTAIRVIKDNLTKYTEKSITDALNKANEEVLEKAKSNPEFEGMGTTIAMCAVQRDNIIAAHIGDSRIYMIEDSKTVFVTKDHSYVQQLVEKGELSEDEAKQHPMKNIITNALGVQGSVRIDFDKKKRPDGHILICSDGVSNLLSEDEIIKITEENTPAKAAKKLCKTAKVAGSTDDLTAIVIDLRGEKI